MSATGHNRAYVRVQFAYVFEGDEIHRQHKYELGEEYELISDQDDY